GSDLTKVKLSVTISPKASLTFTGMPLTGLSGIFDLSKTTKAIVTAESGTAKVDTVLAQTGIKDLDRLIYEFKENYSTPGVSYAISKTATSGIVYKSGIGFCDVENQVRTKPDHLFRLGSISKQFTSISVMKLIQQGKFNVSSKVFGADGILKDDFSNISDRAATVTVRNLLDHSTGWESSPDPMFTGSFSGQTLDQRINYVLSSAQRSEEHTSELQSR